jgi:hypothetical protein
VIDIYTLSDAIQDATRDMRDDMGEEAWEAAVEDAVHAVYDRFRQTEVKPQRWAKVSTGNPLEDGSARCDRVRNYLPSNYSVIGFDAEYVYVTGHDDAGWTLDDYVIPRLASGLYPCQEILPDPA